MNEVNRIINESGLSKVQVAKFLGVSRQMLYNYLAFKHVIELPKDKYNKIMTLLGITKEEELKKIVVDDKYIESLEKKLHEYTIDSFNRETITDLRGLSKKEQDLLSNIFSLLKDKLLEDNKSNTSYYTLKYLYHFLQTIEQVEEQKYILGYMAKSNGFIDPLEFVYNEDKQYTFEGIFYSAMMLYINGGASRNRVSESHKKYEQDIEEKKEETLSRTQELTNFKSQALIELGYTNLNETNAKEVFEKIAEIMSRKF